MSTRFGQGKGDGMNICKGLTVLIFALGSMGALEAAPIDDLSSGMRSFVKNTPEALPFAAGAGLDWSNAYIGQLFDSDFPFFHLGAGLSVGATELPVDGVNSMLAGLGQEQVPGMVLPFAVLNGRIGGFFFPGDVGVKIGFIPEPLQAMNPRGFSFSYNNIGADVRFNLLKSDLVLPDLSVGIGANYLKASAILLEGPTVYLYQGGKTLTVGNPRAELLMETAEVEVKAQISKTFLFLVTPYAGVAAFYGTGSVTARVKANVISMFNEYAYWDRYLGPRVSMRGFGMREQGSALGAKVFAGTSVNLLMVKVDAQAMFNVKDRTMGGVVGLRVQL